MFSQCFKFILFKWTKAKNKEYATDIWHMGKTYFLSIRFNLLTFQSGWNLVSHMLQAYWIWPREKGQDWVLRVSQFVWQSYISCPMCTVDHEDSKHCSGWQWQWQWWGGRQLSFQAQVNRGQDMRSVIDFLDAFNVDILGQFGCICFCVCFFLR